jgi:hypothetical protein
MQDDVVNQLLDIDWRRKDEKALLRFTFENVAIEVVKPKLLTAGGHGPHLALEAIRGVFVRDLLEQIRARQARGGVIDIADDNQLDVYFPVAPRRSS